MSLAGTNLPNEPTRNGGLKIRCGHAARWRVTKSRTYQVHGPNARRKGVEASHEHWTDAYLAAFAMASQAQLVTFDRGLRRFGGVDLLVLG